MQIGIVACAFVLLCDSLCRKQLYGAKAMTKSQRKCTLTKIETHALVFGTEAFNSYLIGKQFVVRLDHRLLVWLQTFKQPNSINIIN